MGSYRTQSKETEEKDEFEPSEFQISEWVKNYDLVKEKARAMKMSPHDYIMIQFRALRFDGSKFYVLEYKDPEKYRDWFKKSKLSTYAMEFENFTMPYFILEKIRKEADAFIGRREYAKRMELEALIALT